jgi:lysophospholipase L1-like esterase
MGEKRPEFAPHDANATYTCAMRSSRDVSGFSDNPFMIGYDSRIFEEDEFLGFRFPQGALVGENSLLSLEDTLKSIHERKAPLIIVNMGDSSTAGWNSDRTFKGNADPLSPLFTYKTYSDLMRGHPSHPHVINAGMPGYSSLQGARYLEILLRRIARAGISVDYVTLYFGNNDGVYNQHEDKVRIDAKKPSADSGGERVVRKDFEKYIRRMLETVAEYGARPILILPPVRYHWTPGIRSQRYAEESEEAFHALRNDALREQIEKARRLYQEGKFPEACECDVVLPRLKKRYKNSLHKIAARTRTPVIDIQRIVTESPEEYFVDYCHPSERANVQLCQNIFDVIQRDRLCRHSPWKRVSDWLHRKKRGKRLTGPSPDIYTVY